MVIFGPPPILRTKIIQSIEWIHLICLLFPISPCSVLMLSSLQRLIYQHSSLHLEWYGQLKQSPSHATLSCWQVPPPIPCPPGEPGKPNDGGYSLKSVLKWKSARYQSVRASHLEAVLFMFSHSMFVQKFVQLQANLHLDTHFPLTHQDQTAVVNVYKKVYRHFR